jgi:hypothetical protein
MRLACEKLHVGAKSDGSARHFMSARRLKKPAEDPIPRAPGRRRGGGATPPEPLAPEEADRLRQVLRRLAAELRSALRAVPEHREGASALARILAIDRATAHRALALAARRDPDPETLAEAPGPDAIEQLARAIGRKRADANGLDLPALGTAIAQFRRALQELGGGSKSRLLRRIAATVPAEDNGDATSVGVVRARREHELREQLFSVTSELLGRHTHTRIDMMICRLNPDDPNLMDYAQIRGLIGHRSRPQAQPLSVELIGKVTASPPDAPNPLLTLDGKRVEDALSGTMIRPFTTSPLPVVVSRGLGDRVRNVVDPAFTAKGNAVDVVVGYQRPRACQHPAFDPVPTLEVGALIREPTRWLILDTWLHRDMVAGAVPSLETYLWSPTLQTSLADHWLDRLPSPPPLLQVLGRGLDRAGSPAWMRQAELTRTAFERLGWDASQYVGFRAEIAYPMWGGAYFAVFDYSK